jgi:hypothetical protein
MRRWELLHGRPARPEASRTVATIGALRRARQVMGYLHFCRICYGREEI